MAEEGGSLRKRLKGKPIEFNRDSLKDFVTGFAKRKQQRREYGAIQQAKKARVARNQARKERRDAMKIQDRVTGAFGDKHSDDSDDELGDAAKQLDKGFPKKQNQQGKQAAAAAAAAAAAPSRQAVHEDEVAVVTVRTSEHDSDAEDSDEEDDDEDDDDDLDAPSRPAGASSTPYVPSAKAQSRATELARAKSIIKTKDGFRKRGMSAKGGHKFKHPKLQSKKKKASGKKGTNTKKR